MKLDFILLQWEMKNDQAFSAWSCIAQ